MRLPFYPYVLQVGALSFFVLLIYFGWGRPIFDPGSAAEKLYRKLNFTTFVEKTMAEPGKLLPVSVVHWIPFVSSGR